MNIEEMRHLDAIKTYKELECAKGRIERLEEALSLIVVRCENVHHEKKHRHEYGEPCPVVALIQQAKEVRQ